ncbi:hypothetical protein GCM10017771_05890 [Streptomyces capitiformicae]|uniref:Uncharacterized protein n=1 Tax=Streptomyces capitiformicae TaxID=2014920 RepID=A0A919L363_9ACTN|nr:hypothetical protein GCM10017771_05890 [Streptomyces capitiformicae]
MTPGLHRIAGITSVLVGIAVAAWLVFGSPHDWEGGMRWLRHGLALASLAVISCGARLMFPDKQESTSDMVSR